MIDHGQPQGLSYKAYQSVAALLEPDEQIDIVITGTMGNLVGTDRRVVVQKILSTQSFPYGEITGVDVL